MRKGCHLSLEGIRKGYLLCYLLFDHNYNKIVKSDWLSTALISAFILLHEKFRQFDWLRAVVFQLNLKNLHVKITNLLWVVV